MTIKRSNKPTNQQGFNLLKDMWDHDSGFRQAVCAHAGVVANDSDAGALFLARQLEEMDKVVHLTDVAEKKVFKFLPTAPVDPGAATFSYPVIDRTGKVVRGFPQPGETLIAARANILGGTPNSSIMRSIVSEYSISFQDIRSAMLANMPLETIYAQASAEALIQCLNMDALYGDATLGIKGLFANQSATPGTAVTMLAGVEAANSAWTAATKTSQDIYDDMVNVLNKVRTQSLGVIEPDMLVMPLSNYNKAQVLPYAPGAGFASTWTIMEYVKRNWPGVTIDWDVGLESTGPLSHSRMVAFKKDPMAVRLPLAVLNESLPPTVNSYQTIVPLHSRYGDVQLVKPLSMAVIDGV